MDVIHREVVICKDVLQDLEKNGLSKINAFVLLGVNIVVENMLKTYIIGFVDSSFNVDDNCPYNLNTCGLAGNVDLIENVQEYLDNDQFNENYSLYLKIVGSQINLWELKKIDDAIQSEKLEFQVQTKEELSNNLLYFRTCMKLELDRKINDSDSLYTASLLEKKIGLKPLFYIKENKQYVGKLEENKTIDGIKVKTNKLNYEVLNISVYQNLSNALTENTDISDFPIIHQTNEPFDEELVCCQLDALCVVPKKATYTQAYNLIYGSIVKNVQSIQSFLVSNPKDLPAVHHFLPDTLCHFVTIVCSHNQIDSYSNLRKKLHNAFHLSMDRPLFRISNAYQFDAKPALNDDGLLTNVHEGLPPSGIKNGKISLIQGTYTFYHYGQGGFNDHQWGCAYRSLQTLYSWFKWQGWTNKPVPSIRDIQQILVDMGDKSKSFVGSSDWIGSMEVSFVLNAHLDVTCRIMSLRQGDTLNSVCLELSEHFDRHGTPVMIGGGVLAHTILGVDINEELGAVKFLVLDPHYTGSDSIKSIQGKGVCWKEASFWKKDTFYNLCLPLSFNGI
uniref:Ufm1-specific protease 2 n=1 Tax=Schizaphis graminum TaxID=13262 RepID=A0A2S2NF88_SCHGA